MKNYQNLLFFKFLYSNAYLFYQDNNSLLNFCMKETFLWQDRLQRFTLLGHSISASGLTNIFGRDPKILARQVLKYVLRYLNYSV